MTAVQVIRIHPKGSNVKAGHVERINGRRYVCISVEKTDSGSIKATYEHKKKPEGSLELL